MSDSQITIPPSRQEVPEGTALAVDARGVRKVYGPTVALADVDFDVRVGEIHGLLGENGAGKSTLVRIMAGVEHADGGRLDFFGSPATGGPAQRRDAGLAFIHQHLGLFDGFSIADNIALGGGFIRRGPIVDERATLRRAQELLDRLDLRLDPEQLVGELPLADQTSVAVARALSSGARLIVLDEPTAYLEAAQARQLFEMLHTLRDQGVSVVLISHRNEDVLRSCDRVTVLRDGRDVAHLNSSDVTERELVRLIAGSEQLRVREANEVLTGRETNVVVSDLQGPGFGPLSFDVGCGEVVGVVGLADAGQVDLGRVIGGIDTAARGTVTVAGSPFAPRTMKQAMAAGVGYVPANRREDGLALEMTAQENLFLDAPGTWWKPSSARDQVGASAKLLQAFGVRPPEPSRVVSTFSGGNQQKVLLGKWLSRNLGVVVLNEPSAGVDIGAKAEIHELIRNNCRAARTSVLVVTTDFREAADLCDRVVVMRRGQVVAVVEGSDLNAERLTELAYGGTL